MLFHQRNLKFTFAKELCASTIWSCFAPFVQMSVNNANKWQKQTDQWLSFLRCSIKCWTIKAWIATNLDSIEEHYSIIVLENSFVTAWLINSETQLNTAEHRISAVENLGYGHGTQMWNNFKLRWMTWRTVVDAINCSIKGLLCFLRNRRAKKHRLHFYRICCQFVYSSLQIALLLRLREHTEPLFHLGLRRAHRRGVLLCISYVFR